MNIAWLMRTAASNTGGGFVDVEQGLTLTRSYTTGTFTAPSSTERSQPVVWACELTFPSTPTEGYLFESGASAIGCSVVLRDGGSILRIRAGDGSSISGPSNQTAFLDVAAPNDTSTYTFVCEMNPSPVGYVSAWLNGTLLGTGITSDSSTLRSSSWAGSNGGSYATVSNPFMTSGEPGGVWPGTVLSNLRFYANQNVDSSFY